MAVSALPHTRARAPLKAATLSPVVLALVLLAPALDLLTSVQRSVAVPGLSFITASVAAAALVLAWAHFPRTSWLAAASLAALASLALRLVHVDVAPVLSLLTVIALGIGGAFATSVAEEAWLA